VESPTESVQVGADSGAQRRIEMSMSNLQ